MNERAPVMSLVARLPISALRLESGRRICTFVVKRFTMQIPHLINLFHGEMAAWRQDLHAHPELGFEVHRNTGKTGV
jgi:hypothetical protein